MLMLFLGFVSNLDESLLEFNAFLGLDSFLSKIKRFYRQMCPIDRTVPMIRWVNFMNSFSLKRATLFLYLIHH